MQHYCPACDRAIEALSAQCPFCAADFNAPNGWRPGPKVKRDHTWSWIAAGAVFAPFVAFIASFAVLCIVECTVLPWFTLYVAPVVAVGLWAVLLVLYLRWRKSLASL